MNQFRKVEQAFTTDLSAYLERLAKVADLRAEQIGDRSPGRGCRCWAVVGECEKRGLLGRGAGHIDWWCAGEWDVPVVEAARRLAAGEGWDAVAAKWGGAT